MDNLRTALHKIKGKMITLKEEFQAIKLALQSKIDSVQKGTNFSKINMAELTVNKADTNEMVKLLHKDLNAEVNYKMHCNFILHKFSYVNDVEKEVGGYLKETFGVKVCESDV
ncbi:hypothetical protein CHUAL_004408 [Chamberlinius hualienensis]